MRRRSYMLGMAFALFLGLLCLAGCAPQTGNTPTPTPSPVESDHASLFTPPPVEPVATPTPTPTPTPPPPFPSAEPVRVIIPRIEVDAPVQTVYNDENNEMQVVPKADVISWHGDSPYPGYPGNSFLAAHHRWGGTPGAFARLYELEPGDIVQIVWADDIMYEFTVRSNNIYSYYEFPMELLEHYGMPAQVTLFTCHGTFDKSIGTSDHRVVVILDPPAY